MAEQSQGNPYQPQWSVWARQFVTVGLVISGIYALTLLTPVIQILIASFLLAFLMYLPSRFVARRTPLNFAGAVIFLYVVLIGCLILLLTTLVPPSVETVRNVSSNLEQQYAQLRITLTNYKPEHGVIELLGTKVDLNQFIQPVRDLILGVQDGSTSGATRIAPFDPGPIISFVTTTITGVLGSIAQFVSTIFLALFLSFLILLELPNYQRLMYRSVPSVHHREMAILLHKMSQVWVGFFRGQVTIGIIIGILTWLQLVLMGVREAVFLAILTGIVSLIPTVGGIIAIIPLGLVPLLQGSRVFTDMPNGTFALLVVAVNQLISQVIWNVVAPKILGDVVSLPLPVIILGVFIGAALGGVLGAFLIVPILGTLRVIVLYLLRKVVQQDPFPGEKAPAITDLGTL